MDIGEIWTAEGKFVFRGKDCIGIFDTENATDAVMQERARVAAAAPDLLAFASAFLEWHEGPGATDSPLAAQARAAIAKASP